MAKVKIFFLLYEGRQNEMLLGTTTPEEHGTAECGRHSLQHAIEEGRLGDFGGSWVLIQAGSAPNPDLVVVEGWNMREG